VLCDGVDVEGSDEGKAEVFTFVEADVDDMFVREANLVFLV